MTRLTLSRDNARGSYVLTDDNGTVLGTLNADRRFRHGETVSRAGHVAVHSGGMRRKGACAGPEHAPVLALNPPSATIPGMQAATWETGRDRHCFTGVLTAGGVRAVVVAPAGGSGPIVADVDGDWQARDLFVLTAAFALLARRRADTMLTAALVSIATGGSGR